MEKQEINHWILVCNSSRFDIHDKFRNEGSCLWNQRRNFSVGDVIYIYETKPVSKIVYKAVVREINIKRSVQENEDNFYSSDFSKEYAFSMECVAANTTNRLQYDELFERYGLSGMKLMKIPKIDDVEFLEYAEDVFAGKLENIPAPPTKEELFQLLPSGSILEQLCYKMDFCEMRDSHVAKKSGVSGSTIGRVRNGSSTKSEYVLAIAKALDFAFVERDNESKIISIDDLPSIIVDKINESKVRTTDLAKECNASPSVISHLKNEGTLPKFEVFEKLIEKYRFKLVKER